MQAGSDHRVLIDRAEKDEYDPYYAGYISLVPEHDVLGFIIEQHRRFVGYVSGLSQQDLDFAYGPAKWTRAQVIGHVIDTERVMAYRALCIAKGDKTMLPGFDQDEYMSKSNFESRPVASLVREFDFVRQANIEMFSSWGQEQLVRIGNANGSKCSVAALVSIIAGHLEHHFHILKERYI